MHRDEQISEIRERLAVVETDVKHIRVAVENHNRLEKKNGNVVIPVAVVISLVEVVKLVLERFV